MARIIHMPLSGGDRKHYARQLAKAEQAQADLEKRAAAAYRVAHRLACEEWNARQFIGGPVDPCPTLAAAIDAGCTWLEVVCRACRHTERVNLRELIWPSDKPISSLTKVLYCRPCRSEGGVKRRPSLVALIAAPTNDGPSKGAALG